VEKLAFDNLSRVEPQQLIDLRTLLQQKIKEIEFALEQGENA